jgi:hypothetical protein
MSWTTPDEFYDLIPTDLKANIHFRQKLHEKLAVDDGLQSEFLSMVLAKPEIAYNTCFFTYNPREPVGYRNLPFILRPAQEDAVRALQDAIEDGHDLVIDKSRDEGATELITKFFTLYWLLVPETTFLMGSRKEEFVEKTGDHKTLFHKIIYALDHLPFWMNKLYTAEKTFRHLRNLKNYASIDGEATNENFGAGDRRTAVLVDELGRIDYKIAQCTIENLSDTSNCNIFNSTHFYGAAHPYNKLLKSGKMPVVVLPWERNPVKNGGIYKSVTAGVIEIKDIEYYQELYPEVFKHFHRMQPLQLKHLTDLMTARYPDAKWRFIADGGSANDGGWRSVWYDKEEERRSSRRDMAQNVDRNPIGSGDMFFDPAVLRRIRLDCIKPPKYKGEIGYKLLPNGLLNKASITWDLDYGKKRLWWWGSLPKGRPYQHHNYIVACDISLGSGSSNSVAGIYDVNTCEKVGMWVCPNTPPEEFADQTIAICHWVGGMSRRPFLIWESNGPGNSFEKRVLKQGYKFTYIEKDERAKRKKRKNRRGWFSTLQKKYDLLLELRIALAEGLKNKKSQHKRLTIFDDAGNGRGTIGEYEDYIYSETGVPILSSQIDESSGARAAHGDRVIPDGLFILAISDQQAGFAKVEKLAREGSLAYRRKIDKANKKNDKRMKLLH